MVDVGLSWVLVLALQPDEVRLFDPGVATLRDGDTPAQIERARIQRHLSRVEATLRAETPGDLQPQQRRAREQALDVLHEYWVAGEFPRNLDHPDRRVPYFIDDDGTACAVGHLMIESGAESLAREIATYENNDFVAEIEHPGVSAWLHDNGLSANEAAWIQPAYGPCGFGDEPLVCGADGNTYLCEYVAVQCAGVEVAHEGACGSETGDSGGSGGGSGGSGDSGSGGGSGDSGVGGGTVDSGDAGGSSGGGSGSGGFGDSGSGGFGDSGSGGGSGDSGGEVIGEEICPAGSTGDDGGLDGTASDDGPGGGSGDSSGGLPPGGGSSDGVGEDGSGGPSETDDDDDKGCGCTTGPGSPLAALPLAFVIAAARRRRS